MAVQSNLDYRQRRAQTVQSTVYAFLHAVVVRSALGRLRWLTFFPLPGGGWRSGYRLLTLRCPPPAASGNSCRGRAVAVRPSLTSMHWRSSGNYCIWHEGQGRHGLSSPGLPPRTVLSLTSAASQWGPEADVVSTAFVVSVRGSHSRRRCWSILHIDNTKQDAQLS